MIKAPRNDETGDYYTVFLSFFRKKCKMSPMKELTLVIGNQNYSSWSLRAWILLKQAGIPFKEIKVQLHQGASKIDQYSPSGKVPVLIDGDIKVWESLAIGDYIAEKFPDKNLWPKDPKARAAARSVSSEMHAGFQALRGAMPMNCRVKMKSRAVASNVTNEIERIQSIWTECRKTYGKSGPFLFGHFTVADAMYAPITVRFNSYSVHLTELPTSYMNTISSLPAMHEWMQAALAEKEKIPELDNLIG